MTTIQQRQPGRQAQVFSEGRVAIEPSDRGGMLRLYTMQARGWTLSRIIPIEEARSQYGYTGADSSD